MVGGARGLLRRRGLGRGPGGTGRGAGRAGAGGAVPRGGIPAAIRCSRRPRPGSGNDRRLRALESIYFAAAGVLPASLGGKVRLRHAEALAWRAFDEARQVHADAASRAEAAAARELALCDRGVLWPQDSTFTTRPRFASAPRAGRPSRRQRRETAARARRWSPSRPARRARPASAARPRRRAEGRRSSASAAPSASFGRARSAGRRRAISPRWPSSPSLPGPSSGFCAENRRRQLGLRHPHRRRPTPDVGYVESAGFRPTAAACSSSARLGPPATSPAGFRSCSPRRCRSRSGPAAPTSWSPSSAGARRPGGRARWRCARWGPPG